MVGIICPPGWDRVNRILKTWWGPVLMSSYVPAALSIWISDFLSTSSLVREPMFCLKFYLFFYYKSFKRRPATLMSKVVKSLGCPKQRERLTRLASRATQTGARWSSETALSMYQSGMYRHWARFKVQGPGCLKKQWHGLNRPAAESLFRRSSD